MVELSMSMFATKEDYLEAEVARLKAECAELRELLEQVVSPDYALLVGRTAKKWMQAAVRLGVKGAKA